MTREEIIQQAEAYANVFGRHVVNYYGVKDAFITGAHSRDEEVEMLQNQIEELSEQLKMNAENIQRLRHSWISVEERLPEKLKNDCTSDYVLTRIDGPRQVWYLVNKYNYAIKAWEGCNGNTAHWMPIPKL